MSAAPTFLVTLAVRDEHGKHTGRCPHLQIEEECTLLANDWHLEQGGQVCLYLEGNRVKFGPLVVRCMVAGRHHTGSIVHDSIRVSLRDARRLVAYALSRRWHVDEHAIEGPFADLFTPASA